MESQQGAQTDRDVQVALIMLPILCSELTFILDREVQRGNLVDSVLEHAYEKCDRLVSLKRPFGAYYEDDACPNVITTIDNDPHYPVGKTYYCREHRHAIFGPQTWRR